MRSFFKIFFATLLAFVVIRHHWVVLLMGVIGSAISPDVVTLSPNSVLVLENQSAILANKEVSNPLNAFLRQEPKSLSGRK